MSMHRISVLLPVVLAAASAPAQNTVPHFSTFFGGGDRDVPMAIHRGPGDVITVVGHTRSQGLATPGAFQQAVVPAPVPQTNGDVDAFVARFIPNPAGPGHVVQWFTYLGGSGLELAFDLVVDAAGVTTVVGLSSSLDFPDPSGSNPPLLQGSTDGFVAQIDATGSTLLSSMFVGGSGDDRVCEIELDPITGIAMIAGNTESTNLPSAVNTFHGGTIDAFVSRLVLGNPMLVRWSVYLGGNNTDGVPYSSWPGFASMWEGNLDRMALALDDDGDPVLATVSFFASIPGYTTSNRVMGQSGRGDIYLAVLDRNAPWPPTYATFFGGSSDDRPKALARHPAGGFVVSGVTVSPDLPTTANCFQPARSIQTGSGPAEAYIAWLDPQRGRRYATYFGGGAGEDNFHAMAIEDSGVVTVGGFSFEASAPTTPRCLWSTPGTSQWFGLIARFELAGRGPADLLYSSMLTQPWGGNTGMVLTGIALDDFGDAWFCGRSSVPLYHLQYPIQTHAGGSDVVLTHVPLLPGGIAGTCVQREGPGFGTPACGAPLAPLYTGMAGAPVPGTTFGVTATNAPPGAAGLLAFGVAAPPQPLSNGWLLVAPLATAFVLSDPQGYARVDVSIPGNLSGPLCWGLGAQWLFLTNSACPGTGLLGNSERLSF